MEALPQRDPIRMEGQIGQEYNCLFTTKELKCKPREDRDPIRLQGDLGKEFDPLRPHGGLPRNRVNQAPQRNPITGVGDFSTEPDFLGHKFKKGASDRQTCMRTDPITHTIPEQGSKIKHSMRQFNERWIVRDPILHRYGDEQIFPEHRSSEMRHFNKNKPGHDILYNSAKDISKYASATLPSRRPYVLRNPITGEGMRPEDYSDVVRLPSEYYFRNNPTLIHHAPPVKPAAKPTSHASRPSRAPISTAPSHTVTKRAKSPVRPATREPPTVKKVIRPKRPATVERTGYARETSPNDRGSHLERTNGFKLEPPPAVVRKPIRKPMGESEAKSIFEEAQQVTNGRLSETHVLSPNTESLPTPNDSLDYSEVAHAVTDENHDELLERNYETAEYEPEQPSPNRSTAMAKPKMSLTTNKGQPVTGSLYEELRAHEQKVTNHIEDPVEAVQAERQKTSVPLCINAEEEDSPVSEGVKFAEKLPEPTLHHDRQEELEDTTDVCESPVNDYVEAFLKTKPRSDNSVDEPLEDSLNNFTPDHEGTVVHSEPEETQSPVEQPYAGAEELPN